MADTDIREVLELKETENIEKEFKSDYWKKTLFTYSQTRGKYWFTNERIIFRGGFATVIDIPYKEIESINTCNVGGLIPIVPTGIKVKMKDGKTHVLSVTKRKENMAFIQAKMN